MYKFSFQASFDDYIIMPSWCTHIVQCTEARAAHLPSGIAGSEHAGTDEPQSLGAVQQRDLGQFLLHVLGKVPLQIR